MSELQKQVESPPVDGELVAMKKRIDAMQILYVALFVASLVLLITNWQTNASSSMHVVWALSLGGAVLVRVIRSSMVSKYNSAVSNGRPAPMQ
jgi:hypothetical protein